MKRPLPVDNDQGPYSACSPPAAKKRSVTPSPSSYTKKFACKFDGCEKAYTKPSKLADHERSHTGVRPFCCPEPGCDKSFLRKSHLQAHARSHLPKHERPFICSVDQCGKRFSTNQHLSQHLKLHTEPRPYRCDRCDMAFRKHHQLSKHTAEHLGTKACICPHQTCGKSFTYQSILDNHIARVHDSSRQYTCEVEECSEHFPKWSMLKAHCKEMHRFNCQYCKKAYTDSTAFKLHVSTHELPLEARQSYACDIDECDKKFTKAHALKQHVLVVHQSVRRFVCEACDKSFAYKKSLQKHAAKAHSDKGVGDFGNKQDKTSAKAVSLLEKLTGYGYDVGRDIPCTFPNCAYRFTRDYDLHRHLNGSVHAVIDPVLQTLQT